MTTVCPTYSTTATSMLTIQSLDVRSGLLITRIVNCIFELQNVQLDIQCSREQNFWEEICLIDFTVQQPILKVWTNIIHRIVKIKCLFAESNVC